MVTLRARTIISYFFGFVITFFIAYRSLYSYSSYVENAASCLLYPFIHVQHKAVVYIQSFVKKREKNNALRHEIEILKEKNATLLAQNIELQAVHHYIEETQELIKFKEKYASQEAHLGHIIMKHFSDYEQSFLVDRGSLHGITPDMVAVYKNCLVGRITQVYPYYSKVILITDVSCKVAAYCRSSKARGIHEGGNNDHSTCLQFVSHLHQLQENDLVISSGEGLIFPQGFALGKLHSFELDGLHYTTHVDPLLKFSELEYCYLIKKN